MESYVRYINQAILYLSCGVACSACVYYNLVLEWPTTNHRIRRDMNQFGMNWPCIYVINDSSFFCRGMGTSTKGAQDRSARCPRCPSTTPWRCCVNGCCWRWLASRCVRRTSGRRSPTGSSCRMLANEVCGTVWQLVKAVLCLLSLQRSKWR